MLRTSVAFLLAAATAPLALSAQLPPTPPTFRLVAPHSRGAIVIDTTNGWRLDRAVIYDKGNRPVVQLNNEKLGLIASYILDDEPQYNDTTQACLNDTLGTIMHDALAQATVTHKTSDSRTLADGQTVLLGSYLIEKNGGVKLDQENVFGFIAAHHLCAEVHISRTHFKPGDEAVFDPVLRAFKFEPEYAPTPRDFALMASLLPPDMAAEYRGKLPSSDAAASPAKDASASSQSLDFALPNHPGVLHLDAPGFEIKELSAKPNGKEFGIRAEDTSSHALHALGFLFVSEPAQPTAVACRDWMLNSEKSEKLPSRKNIKLSTLKSNSGVDIAEVDYEVPAAPLDFRFNRRIFVASGDLCADILFSLPNHAIAALADTPIRSLTFDPSRPPDMMTRFRYASVLFAHDRPDAAAPIYEEAIPLAAHSDDPLKWRRVLIDQASMSYGMAGDLKKSRALNEAAIAADPDYPLYYYNLACADAESNDAAAARTHLQQAFDRRANTLPGEHLADPTKDDSILKLKSNKAFWTFVQALPKS